MEKILCFRFASLRFAFALVTTLSLSLSLARARVRACERAARCEIYSDLRTGLDDVDLAVANDAFDVLWCAEGAFDGDAGASDGVEDGCLRVAVPDDGIRGVVGVVTHRGVHGDGFIESSAGVAF